jgi:hypothetical protein
MPIEHGVNPTPDDTVPTIFANSMRPVDNRFQGFRRDANLNTFGDAGAGSGPGSWPPLINRARA